MISFFCNVICWCLWNCRIDFSCKYEIKIDSDRLVFKTLISTGINPPKCAWLRHRLAASGHKSIILASAAKGSPVRDLATLLSNFHHRSIFFATWTITMSYQHNNICVFLPLVLRNLYPAGFKYFYVHPYLGKMSNLTNIFQMGWFNHQPDIKKISRTSPSWKLPHVVSNPESSHKIWHQFATPMPVHEDTGWSPARNGESCKIRRCLWWPICCVTHNVDFMKKTHYWQHVMEAFGQFSSKISSMESSNISVKHLTIGRIFRAIAYVWKQLSMARWFKMISLGWLSKPFKG